MGRDPLICGSSRVPDHNAAFAKLSAGTVDSPLKPENKATLTAILSCHVAPGRLSAAAIAAAIKAGGGKAEFTTARGETLSASFMGSMVMLRDAKGGMSHVRQADVRQSDGVIHGVDAVLLP